MAGVAAPALRYERRRPERTALYEVVRDNLETLYGAIADGALEVRVPKHARKELEAFLECGLLCRGFARLRCGSCEESRLVAFSCKGRGFCPSCMGRRMCETAANLVEHVLPRVALRQWVLTFPFAWRRRLARDGVLLGALTRIFVEAVQRFYARPGERTGAVTVVQRTSSDLRLNPHLHVVFLDGAYREEGGALVWSERGHVQTREVGEVLGKALARMARWLERRGLLATVTEDGAEADDADGEARLVASAVSGQAPPAGPQWLLSPLAPQPLAYDKPLCASQDGFTLHAATRAGAEDDAGREALLRYVLRPPVAQERIEARPAGFVRIVLKRAFRDGTVAVELDPLSLLCRLATSVPPPRYHTVKYAGVLAPASPWRKAVAPAAAEAVAEAAGHAHDDPAKGARGHDDERPRRSRYRPWAELLRRTFAIDVLACPRCQGRLELIALVRDPKGTKRLLRALGEPTEAPERTPCRGPPYWKSTVLRQKALGYAA